MQKAGKAGELVLPTSTLVISPQLALQIIRMSEADWAMVDDAGVLCVRSGDERLRLRAERCRCTMRALTLRGAARS